ncbi:tetraacyldisaccharide 4'-kinase [Psychrobacter aestuarii]|uniref:Tetraacyldisaccharide 4'-kinase n=1 Tax=Psychrobacter aestuarii TaxID=556327 RepID=A0ABN0VYB6_9GAMM|nr:tetraacyldisaccharide 4'-kinase [Psychrobacter aestuarii]
MSLETTITRAWQRQAAWLWFLLPLSWLYAAILHVRQWLYKSGIKKSYRAPIPVLVIGNITVGGSGKTPLIIRLVHHLQQQGIEVGVISRGYGGDTSAMPALVTPTSSPDTVGDEPCLIVGMTGVPMAVCPNRQQAIETLLTAVPTLQLIIADDGLQHYALARDMEWIVVDSARGFGNRQLLPTGFLREPLSRLKGAVVMQHHKPDAPPSPEIGAALSMYLQPDALQPLIALGDSTATLSPPQASDTVHAVSGIGYPQRFFDTLSDLGFETVAHPYPDHHPFRLEELLAYDTYPIVVTAKDAIKIRPLLLAALETAPANSSVHHLAQRLWVLPVNAVLSAQSYQTLHQQLSALKVLPK